MKKFSFGLDKVLSYKRQYENSLKNEHAVALRELAIQREKIAELERKDEDTRTAMAKDRLNGCTILQIRTYEGYLRYVREEIKNENMKLEALKLHEEKKRRELIEAKKETASIDKLKERKMEEYTKEEQKEQELMVEEFVNHSLQVHLR